VDKNPNVLTVALANAHKFVPERVTNIGPAGSGGGTDSLLGAATILGDLLNPGTPNARPATPAAPPPAQPQAQQPRR
jgi:hypothetical protein